MYFSDNAIYLPTESHTLLFFFGASFGMLNDQCIWAEMPLPSHILPESFKSTWIYSLKQISLMAVR